MEEEYTSSAGQKTVLLVVLMSILLLHITDWIHDMNKFEIAIDESWKNVLIDEFDKKYFSNIKKTLVEEMSKYSIYPPKNQIFSAFNKTPFDNVSVVLLGQDPYHGAGQAHGLCFSVPHGFRKPPSLNNIFKEINADIGIPIPKNGNLEKWADQGVLLLNATLTVRESCAGSHQKIGWETFTDRVIQTISDQKKGVVFLLWGKYAQAKSALINTTYHHILNAAHPSPLSAYNGFFGCRHFSKTNKLLEQQSKQTINWSIE